MEKELSWDCDLLQVSSGGRILIYTTNSIERLRRKIKKVAWKRRYSRMNGLCSSLSTWLLRRQQRIGPWDWGTGLWYTLNWWAFLKIGWQNMCEVKNGICTENLTLLNEYRAIPYDNKERSMTTSNSIGASCSIGRDFEKGPKSVIQHVRTE